MEEATRIYSYGGFFAETIHATDVRSRADARKLGPFVSGGKLVLWINWSRYEDGGLKRHAHFRRYPKNSTVLKDIVITEVQERRKFTQESNKHKKAKTCIAEAIKYLKENKLHLPWTFKDSRSSDYRLSGDLMADVEVVETEFSLRTPFNTDYFLDVAVLGPVIKSKRIILAAIEIEHTHRFEFSKALVCKTLGFPLMSIDIEKTPENEIGIDWARKALMETKVSSDDKRRRNYVYVHPMLYSVYLDFPRSVFKETRHQFIIFCRDSVFEKMLSLIKELVSVLKIDPGRINIAPVRDKNEQTKKQIHHAGLIAGDNWKEYSDHQFIQVSVDKPPAKCGALYMFHLVLAQLCNSRFPSLVGYKYELGVMCRDGAEPYWRTTMCVDGELQDILVAPMKVSEPIEKILEIVSGLEK